MPTIPDTKGSSNSPNTEAEQHKLKHIKVYLTGYGPFPGIAENPSGQMANSLLPETCISIHLNSHFTLKITIHPHSTPIRVAYADVERIVSEIYTTESFDYILHVGVGLGGGFELEKIAYGDGYYMGDVDGLLPGGKEAKSDYELKNEGLLRHWGGDGSIGPTQDVPMETGLDVDWIVKMVLNGKIKLFEGADGEERGYTAALDQAPVTEGATTAPKKASNNKELRKSKGYKIRPSKDAGRYLCEYIYRKSLEQAISRCEKGGRKPWDWRHDTLAEEFPARKTRSEGNISKRVLFMHVPPVGNLYTVAEDVDCLKQVVVGMVLDGEGLRKNLDDFS
ncbi:peptidase C15, pyroglutamyl peptidase I-like protein [Terfezia boudieri ATCC MYA-4762]|uniref:Peptidase C15, pyroglutamyl peptidase I-like protein n=1 Tax=Terfezia boudieri ATCC MYA-4762 TaxID=1051890 RepID=A0A3N4LMB5_9PEZI|nr:peptidase C15, pyroglutamyl peptidase I-like protein [Terfezia boudieri ATCC MYA-4762]